MKGDEGTESVFCCHETLQRDQYLANQELREQWRIFTRLWLDLWARLIMQDAQEDGDRAIPDDLSGGSHDTELLETYFVPILGVEEGFLKILTSTLSSLKLIFKFQTDQPIQNPWP
ncbi:hypothetical protein VNO78_20620 [Psophocarpus tetragonolobus]|uniref:Uncharacterized protein n=1 Tax=Psophocarpus tetragonolobus TaxID=3891 RepID=A0AAN9SAL8_PSOTE